MLKKDLNTTFEKAMAIFDLKRHRAALTYYKTLTRFGYTFEDVHNFIRTEQDKIKQQEKEIKNYLSLMKKCPECIIPMVLLSVNDHPSTQTGDLTDKSVWFCRKCLKTMFNKESIDTITREGNSSRKGR